MTEEYRGNRRMFTNKLRKLLRELIDQGGELDQRAASGLFPTAVYPDVEFTEWRLRSIDALEQVGTRAERIVRDIRRAPQSELFDVSSVRSIVAALGAASTWVADEASIEPVDQTTGTDPSQGSNRVFIVHGRDSEIKDQVAEHLRSMNLDPIILNEQANQGLTVIEKFEKHADVAFAVVLMTPDDIGGPQSQGGNLGPRARQNVIFELGFFIGKLGRNRVCALTSGEVEIPSDYSGRCVRRPRCSARLEIRARQRAGNIGRAR